MTTKDMTTKDMTTKVKKPRGRPKGSGAGVKLGPRPGSRPYLIANLKHGQRAFLEAPPGDVQRFMQQVQADITRCDLQGKVTQALVLGIQPSTRTVYELVMLTRIEE